MESIVTLTKKKKSTFDPNDILYSDTELNKYLIWEADKNISKEDIKIGKKLFTPEERISNLIEYGGVSIEIKEVADILVEAKHKK